MSWMNESEIKIAQMRVQGVPVLQDAANFLARFCNLINSISDGWPYWGYGTRCSNDLQKIVNEGQWPINQCEATRVSRKEVDKACNKIRNFLHRCKQTKDNPAVIAFLDA